jgi:hypothetical protein
MYNRVERHARSVIQKRQEQRQQSDSRIVRRDELLALLTGREGRAEARKAELLWRSAELFRRSTIRERLAQVRAEMERSIARSQAHWEAEAPMPDFRARLKRGLRRVTQTAPE